MGDTGNGDDAPVLATLSVESDSAEVDLRVHFHWRRAGEVTVNNGKLQFPHLPRSPGVYRLTFIRRGDRPRVYVGESDDLARRARNYRNPGPTQPTSQRVHDDLLSHLQAGGTVSMAVAIEAGIEAGGPSTALPMGRKIARVLAEHAALGMSYLDGNVVVMNKDRGN